MSSSLATQMSDNSFVCIGGLHEDLLLDARSAILHNESVPVSSRSSCGGVAYNVWHTLAQLLVPCKLVSVLGSGPSGRSLGEHCKSVSERFSHSVTTDLYQSSDAPDARYIGVFDTDRHLFLGLADMDIYEQHTAHFVQKTREALAEQSCILFDTNLSAEFFAAIKSKLGNSLCICVSASPEKIKRIAALRGIDTLFLLLNKTEARELIYSIDDKVALDISSDALVICQRLQELGFFCVCVTDKMKSVCFLDHDSTAVLTGTQLKEIHQQCEYLLPNGSNTGWDLGVGDAFVAGLIAAIYYEYTIDDALTSAAICAWIAAQSEPAVSHAVQWDVIKLVLKRHKNSLHRKVDSNDTD